LFGNHKFVFQKNPSFRHVVSRNPGCLQQTLAVISAIPANDMPG